MGPRFCPNCEQPVSQDDRNCDVCNAPLSGLTGGAPDSMGDQAVAAAPPRKGFEGIFAQPEREAGLTGALASAESKAEPLAETSSPVGETQATASAGSPSGAAEPNENLSTSSAEQPPVSEPSLGTFADDPSNPADMGIAFIRKGAKTKRLDSELPTDENPIAKEARGAEDAEASGFGKEESHALAEREDIPVADQAESGTDDSPGGETHLGQPSTAAPPAEEFKASGDATFEQPTEAQKHVAPRAIPLPKEEPKPLEIPFGAVIPPPPQEPLGSAAPYGRGKTGDFLGGPVATPQDLQSRLDAEIITTCKRLVNQGYGLYGLFGRPSTGKSSLVYALRHHFIKGDPGFGGYAPDGENWDELARDLESQWNDRQIPTNADRPHTYLAQSPRGKEHIAIMDIAGERFEGVQSWTDEVFEFFGLYLGYCKGFFILVELDDLASAAQVGHDASARIQSQMARIVRFLAVAAQMEKLRDLDDVKAKRAAAEEAVAHTGKVKVKVPVALCLSKADTVGQMQFGPELGRVVPGSTSPQSDPWNVLQAVWPEHVATLLNMVPKLKVDWLSCLGTDFESQRLFSGSVGLRGAFQHVVSHPPPKWALSTKHYLRLQRALRL